MHFLLEVLWFIFPAYAANSIAVDVSGIPFLKDFSTPMDFGRNIGGRRVFGDGKTWRGFFCGILAGVIVGWIQSLLQANYSWNLPEMSLTLAFLLSLGAMVGDLAASAIKRRCGFERGHSLPFIDQLDFVFGAFYFAWIIVPADLAFFATALVVTVPIHYFANYVAWVLKLKKSPW
ncbi:MAG: CDP-2,3-bis-(O-geranylgeranyl)-sn-glycerol synthase [Candidatus Altiarchaeota archaeon]|nr:CDP-2,3-bis-(O-geranylgeranyl)-sn-glycerol synthase [Candidatus Altiarchaeota archaeon]